MRRAWSLVSVSRLSPASFGRMAIRFSCCESQPTMFMKKSRLPEMLIATLDAKSESPITTTRVSGGLVSAGLSPPGGVGSAAFTGCDAATPTLMGPRRSPPLASSSFGPSLAATLSMSVSAQLRSPVCTIGCAVTPPAPVSAVTDRARGNAVSVSKRSVIGCGG